MPKDRDSNALLNGINIPPSLVRKALLARFGKPPNGGLAVKPAPHSIMSSVKRTLSSDAILEPRELFRRKLKAQDR